jgi:sigma-54 dependent transcriptional regulator, acetoin dehydrogenase operon transcriptional activator AcoR
MQVQSCGSRVPGSELKAMWTETTDCLIHGAGDNAWKFLLSYRWAGNVRELQNVAAYLAFVIDGQVSIDTLPQYILEETEDFQAELRVLSRKATIEELKTAFEALSRTTGIGRRMGRKNLAKLICSKDRHVSEGEVRGILSAMKGLSLVIQYTGRRGTEMTPRGLAFSRWLKNQH